MEIEFRFKKQIVNFVSNTKVHIIFLLALACLTILWRLNEGSLADFDEATYAQISKEMLETGNWTDLHWQGENWFEKPPLVFWLTALNYKFFGVSTLTIRLWPAFLGVATILVVYFLGVTLFKSKTVGFFAAGILLTSSQFIHMSRILMLDIPVTFFITTSLLSFWLSQNKSPYFLYLSTISAGLAVMTKGATGFIPIIIILVYLLVTRRFKKLKWKIIFVSLLLFLVIVFPWYLLGFKKFGSLFWQKFFTGQTLTILGTQHPLQSLSKMIYLDTFIYGFYLWFYLSLAAFLYLIWRLITKKKGELLFIFLWIIIVLLIFLLMKTNVPQYTMPIYPALALLVAFFLKELTFSTEKIKFLPLGSLIFLIIFILRIHLPEPLHCNNTLFNINKYQAMSEILVHESVSLTSGRHPGPIFYLGIKRLTNDELTDKYLHLEDKNTLFVNKTDEFFKDQTFKGAKILLMGQDYTLFARPEYTGEVMTPTQVSKNQDFPLQYCYPYITLWLYEKPLIY